MSTDILQGAERPDRTQGVLPSPGAGALVERMRSGDAEAVGELVEQFGGQIRRHFRRKIGSSMHRLVDSQDLLSTIARRLCQRVKNERVRAENQRQLWALIYQIGDAALIDRVKIMSRLRELEGDGSPFVQSMRQQIEQIDATTPDEFSEEFQRLLGLLSPQDQELLLRWFNGQTLADAGAALGLNAAAARQRWLRIRRTLEGSFER